MTDSRKCRNGHDLPDGYRFCGVCGAPEIVRAVPPPTERATPRTTSKSRKRFIIPAVATALAAIAVAAVVVTSGTNNNPSPTSDEIRHDLVVDACGESNGPVKPVSEWKSATASAASAHEIRLDSGAVYLVLFHGNSVADNSEIYLVQCYSPEGGLPYRRTTVAWADGGQTYELTDAPSAAEETQNVQPSENAAPSSAATTPVLPPLDCDALDIPDITCSAGRMALAKCGVTHLTFVGRRDHGLEVWQAKRGSEDITLYTSSSLEFGGSVLSCGRPDTKVDLPLFWNTVLQENRTAFDVVPNLECATSDTELVLDEQPAGTVGFCSLWLSGEPHWYVKFTLTNAPPYFDLAERTRGS